MRLKTSKKGVRSLNEKEKRGNQISAEVRAQEGEDGKRKIVGYAVKWNELSNPIWGLFREQFEKGAFQKWLSDPNNKVIASWQHRLHEVLGKRPKTLEVHEDDIGLRYEIDPPSWADKYVETIERGDVDGSSFIFIPIVEEWDETEDMAIRTIKEAELHEVSPVTYPAYSQSTSDVRGADGEFRSADKVFEKFKSSKDDYSADLAMKKKKLELLEKI